MRHDDDDECYCELLPPRIISVMRKSSVTLKVHVSRARYFRALARFLEGVTRDRLLECS